MNALQRLEKDMERAASVFTAAVLIKSKAEQAYVRSPSDETKEALRAARHDFEDAEVLRDRTAQEMEKELARIAQETRAADIARAHELVESIGSAKLVGDLAEVRAATVAFVKAIEAARQAGSERTAQIYAEVNELVQLEKKLGMRFGPRHYADPAVPAAPDPRFGLRDHLLSEIVGASNAAVADAQKAWDWRCFFERLV